MTVRAQERCGTPVPANLRPTNTAPPSAAQCHWEVPSGGALSSVAMERRPARLEDVAREAGVHVSTVSRVLNRRDTRIPARSSLIA